MGKFKEILRTGALLSGMMAAEGKGARGQQPLEASQNTQTQAENKKQAVAESADKAINENIEASSIEDLKVKLEHLLKKKYEEIPIFDPDTSEQAFLYWAVSHFDNYKSIPGAEDFAVESGNKLLIDSPDYFFSSLDDISEPLPEKFEKLVIRAAQEYPLEALQNSEVLEKFEKTYPQVILATLNRKKLAQYDLKELNIGFRVLLKLTATHPAFDMLKEVLAESAKIKAKENPDEILELGIGNFDEWVEEIFINEKSKEEFYYIFLSGLIVKGSSEDILRNFQLFVGYEVCRPLLFAMVEQAPERILERAVHELIEGSISEKNPTGMNQSLKSFYFSLVSEALLKVKVGEGEIDYKPSVGNWAFIKHLYPDLYESQRRKFEQDKRFEEIFGENADLKLDP